MVDRLDRMVEYTVKSRELIQTRVGNVSFAIDYSQFFDNRHDPHRAKTTTEAVLNQVSHGQTVKAEYSNPLGPRVVEDYEVPATWAIGHALENQPGSIQLPGRTVNRSVRDNGSFTAIERTSALTITPIAKDGKRLVTERAQDGQIHHLFIHWIPEEQAQNWLKAEREFIRRRK